MRDDDAPTAGRLPDTCSKMCGHGLAVMRHQDSPCLRRQRQYLWIRDPYQPGRLGSPKVHAGHTPERGFQDHVVQGERPGYPPLPRVHLVHGAAIAR